MELDFEKEYKAFLDKWGMETQMRMAVEEMSELTKEICKYIRYTKDYSLSKDDEKVLQITNDLKGEVADVLNCVEQVRYMFGKDEVDLIRKAKIERTLKRLEETNKN